MPPRTKAFTLIEVVVTLAILSILIAASTYAFSLQIKKAWDAHRKEDLYSLKTALEDYYDDHTLYPDSLPDCDQPIKSGDVTLIAHTPCEPNTNQPYLYQVDNGQSPYFRLYTRISNLYDPSIAAAGCGHGCGPDCRYNYGVSSTNVDLERCIPIYVCSPGGGKSGSCEIYADPVRSQCPVTYPDDPTCSNACGDPKNRCKNASGKNRPG